ncbi:MAG: D-glycero-beta-D-manno-heptose 1-phosphate adenylyltransferase [Caldimicrobium sp.]
MTKEITFGIVQMEITTRLEKNLEKILSFIKLSKSEVLLFPELALTGYLDLRGVSPEEIFSALRELQANLDDDKIILLGCPFHKDQFFRNAYVLVSKNGIQVLAEKMLLFPGLDDRVGFKPGGKRDIFFLKDLPFVVLICFELRCPELARAFLREGIEGIFIPAQWPEARIDHFLSLLKARALENQVYALGVNGLGKIGDIFLGGNSALFSPSGEEIFNLKKEETLKEIKISFFYERLPYPLKTPYLKMPKLIELPLLQDIVEKRRKKGQIMVFTNGCFDMLHAGHVDYLQRARSLGDFLVVGVNSDTSIKKIKGPSRPVLPEKLRIEALSALACVDYIVLFEEDTPEKLIQTLKPDILVKGADWEEDKIVGASFVKSYGGKVIRLEFTYEISTSMIIEKIKKNTSYK